MKTALGFSYESVKKLISSFKNLRKTMKKLSVFLLYLIILVQITSSSQTTQIRNQYTNSINPDDFEVIVHNIKIDIINEQEVNVAERYEIRNKLSYSVNSIYLWINQSLENLLVSDSEGELIVVTDKISDSSYLLNIDFRSELSSNESTVFNVWYSLENTPIPEQGDSYYFFEYYSSVSYFIKEQKIEMKIPERSLIHEEEGVTSFYPLTERPIAGKRVYIEWIFRNIEPFENKFVFVRFDKPIGTPPIWAIVLGPFFGVIIGIVGTILFMRRKDKKVMKKVASIFLSDTQKLLIKLISENDGKILQKELCAKTGFTKSRISRNITPLVEQKLVKREKWGRNYILTLTENGKKVVE